MSHPGWNSVYSPLGSPEQYDGQQWSGATRLNEQEAFTNDIGNEPQGRYYDLSPELDSSRRFSQPRRPVAHRDSTQSFQTLLTPKETFNSDSRKSTYTLQSFQLDQNSRQDDSTQVFKPWKQFFDLFKWGLLRFLCTCALAIGLYTTLFKFSEIKALDSFQKHTFNFLFTGISMMLGVNLASSFKHVAIDTRWWILSRKKRPLSQVENILNCHSQLACLKLGITTMFKQPGLASACAIWLIINLGAQVMVAMISLNFTIGVPVADWTKHVPGLVQHTNMTQLYYGQIYSQAAENYTAHTLGDISAGFPSFDINGTKGREPPVPPFMLTNSKDNFGEGNYSQFYFNAEKYSQYVFLDSPADSQAASTIGTFYSNRSVTTDASCFMWPVRDGVGGDTGKIDYGDGSGKNLTANFDLYSPLSTTYKVGNYPKKTPGRCGPRCGTIVVFENNGTTANYFECNVTVSVVANATHPAQNISDNLAVIFAHAIALQGFGTNQEQRYPNSFLFGTFTHGSRSTMEWLLRNFVAGAITAADTLNPWINEPIEDLVPSQATSLTLDHPANIRGIIFGLIGGHLLLFIVGLILSNRVVVTDESALATARVLRPVVDKLGTQGSLLDADEICKRMGDPKMVYGPSLKVSRQTGGTLRHIEISEHAAVEKRIKQWRGKYD